MKNVLLCSNCFNDHGLIYNAQKIGFPNKQKCPNCKSIDGRKLDDELLNKLVYQYFVRGTLVRCEYGAFPYLQFNSMSYSKDNHMNIYESLQDDLNLLADTIKVRIFPYGPRTWMFGEIEPLQNLLKKSKRKKIINRILNEYPIRILSSTESFYRLRKGSNISMNPFEFDSQPDLLCGKGRLDSQNFPVLYGSQDLDVCLHECRVTMEDELFVATIKPNRDLRLLNLTEVLKENVTEFESLDLTIHMLFLAGDYSYDISREIAISASKKGFDGIIYPSYFSLIRTGAEPYPTIYGMSIRRLPVPKEYIQSQIIQNIALFGRPIENEIVSVNCINKVIINQVAYDLTLAPKRFGSELA
jgi:hypothetical protein